MYPETTKPNKQSKIKTGTYGEPVGVAKERDPVEENRERLVRKVMVALSRNVRHLITAEMYDHFHRTQQEIARQKKIQAEIIGSALSRLARGTFDTEALMQPK